MSAITQSKLIEILQSMKGIPFDPEVVTYIDGYVYPVSLVSVTHDPPYTVLQFDAHEAVDESGGDDYIDENIILSRDDTPQWIKNVFIETEGRDPRYMLKEIELFSNLAQQRALQEIMGQR